MFGNGNYVQQRPVNPNETMNYNQYMTYNPMYENYQQAQARLKQLEQQKMMNGQNNLYYNQTQQNNINVKQYDFVNGIEGAKAYRQEPNTTMILFDSDSDVFFIKSTDQNGQPTLKGCKYEEFEIPNVINNKDEIQKTVDDKIKQVEEKVEKKIDEKFEKILSILQNNNNNNNINNNHKEDKVTNRKERIEDGKSTK